MKKIQKIIDKTLKKLEITLTINDIVSVKTLENNEMLFLVNFRNIKTLNNQKIERQMDMFETESKESIKKEKEILNKVEEIINNQKKIINGKLIFVRFLKK